MTCWWRIRSGRRSGELIEHVMACLARACPSWHDDVWLVDSTPVECGRSRETQKRSDLAGWATYGYSASHSRYFWGLRPHLITTPSGLPITFALAGAKADERDDSSPSPPRSGTTKPPNNQAPPAPCSPTTTDPLELII